MQSSLFARRLVFGLLVALFWIVVILPADLIASEDIVILENGDKITGEIKGLSKGALSIDPDYGENIFMVDWNEVKYIESAREFIAETADGDRLVGSVKTDPQSAGQILIEEQGGVVILRQDHLTYLKPVEEDFWGRLDFSVDFGLGFTKADDTKQLNARAGGGYLTEKWVTKVRLDTLYNARREADTTKRSEISGDYRYYFKERWFGLGRATFLQSDELELDLRSTVGGGIGNSLVRNNRWLLSAFGGAAWTNENYEDPALAVKDSAEAFAGVELDIFDIGALDIISTFAMIPSLSESGRIRMDFSTDLEWELIKDIFFRVGFTNNYNSSPPNDIPKNDYVFSTSIGWSY